RTTYADKGQRVFIKGVGYPLTLQGEKEYTKHWYLEFRNNIWIVFIRDFIGLVMLGISVWLTLSKILQSSQ
ncbi:MAG: hypothetical protein J0M11_23355, partial [Anaerolineae bacterium]|nr:hypothetical protein [Anaerolineae bacterium]